MKTKKCAFTGHRPQSLPFGFNEADERCIALKQKLRDEIIRQIEENGVTHFITGMAIGVDMFAAEIVLGLKSAYNGITLECAIPCETQAEKWSEALRDRYFDIASKCDKETLCSSVIRRIVCTSAIVIWWTRLITLLQYGTANRVAQGKPYSMRNSRVSRCVSSIP